MNNKLAKNLEKFSMTVGSISIIVMMILITMEIFMRTLFNQSLLMADEYSGYLMAIVVYWGAVPSFHADTFVRVEALYQRFNPKMKSIANKIYQLLFLIFNSYMVYFFYQSVRKIFKYKSVSSTIVRTPLIIPMGISWLGILIFEIYLIFVFIQNIKTKVGDKQ